MKPNLDEVVYLIWRDGDEWACSPSHIQGLNTSIGYGKDPRSALKECQALIDISIGGLNG